MIFDMFQGHEFIALSDEAPPRGIVALIPRGRFGGVMRMNFM